MDKSIKRAFVSLHSLRVWSTSYRLIPPSAKYTQTQKYFELLYKHNHRHKQPILNISPLQLNTPPPPSPESATFLTFAIQSLPTKSCRVPPCPSLHKSVPRYYSSAVSILHTACCFCHLCCFKLKAQSRTRSRKPLRDAQAVIDRMLHTRISILI